MNTIFSTADVHPRDAFDYWHEVLCRELLPHDCQPEDRKAFRGRIEAGACSTLALIRYEGSPMLNDVTPRHLSPALADSLFIRLQTGGEFIGEQDGREVVLQAGDMTLFDPRRPSRGKYGTGATQMVMTIPRRELEVRVGDVQQMMARAMRPSEVEHSLASAYAAMLPTYAGKLSAAADSMVADQVLDLIGVSVTRMMDRERPRVSSARSLVLLKLRAVVAARLADPALDADTVAAGAGVSVRYANAVLAQHGMSISRLIWTQRLERCRRALQDQSQVHRTITEIAFGWGFSDMTHFGRRFKSAYGVLPSEYRRESAFARMKNGAR